MASSLLSRVLTRRLMAVGATVPTKTAFQPLGSLSQFSSGAWVPGIGRGKTTTGLVGLAVDHDAVSKIVSKYQLLLDTMAASDMPESAAYRQAVEKVCRYRIRVAQENPDDPEKVEELINCGQVEELVVQADDEMEVLQMYLRERWWERVGEHEPEIDPDDFADDEEYEAATEEGK